MVDTPVSLQTNLDFLIERFCFNLTCYKIIGSKIKKLTRITLKKTKYLTP
jgi:hypothetical protein